MKTSFVCTVLNEKKTIQKLINSLKNQTKKIDEIIIVDGGSSDSTLAILKKNKGIKPFIKRGNRSIGRNYGISKSTNQIILISDAGCVLHKDWVKNITKPFEKKTTDVVAGYYKAQTSTIFQQCLVPYVLVMPDKVNANNFLPASRSMAFRKSAWEKAGKFPQKFSHNEDYVFAKKLKTIRAKVIFAKNAIAYWTPRNNTSEAYEMFYRFAYGDAEAGIIRGKVVVVYLRYLIILLLAGYLFLNMREQLYIIPLLFLLYIGWSIFKNYKYVKKVEGVLILPVIQMSSDLAVLIGTTFGFIKLVKVILYEKK